MIRKYFGLFIGVGIVFFNFWILFYFLPILWSSSHVFLFLILFMTVTSFSMIAFGILEMIAFFTNQNSGIDILVNKLTSWSMRWKQ